MENRVSIAALIFDLDGTLVDSADDIAEAVNRTLEDLSLPRAPEAVVRGWIGSGARQLLADALTHAGSARRLDEAMPNFMRHYRDCLLLSPRLYAGVREALRQFHARGLPMAVCSNKPSAMIEPLLEHLRIGDFFSHLVGGDTLPQRKPAPEPLWHLARLFGQPPSRCLMVGDSATDLHAANAAGMAVALVRYGYRQDLDLDAAGAWAVVDDLRELLARV